MNSSKENEQGNVTMRLYVYIIYAMPDTSTEP
jgi:hypothetical protein